MNSFNKLPTTTIDRFIRILPFLCLLSCTPSPAKKPTQSIFFFKDKDGIYEYDFTTEKESLIFKVSTDDIFLDEPYLLENDTLTFGIVGESIQHDAMEKLRRETYVKKYISLDLTQNRHWLSKKVTHEVYRSDTLEVLKMMTECFDAFGKKESAFEENVKYEGEIRSYKGITYGKESKRMFYWEAKLGQRTVYSDMGNLFLVDGLDTSLLAEMEGRFNPKFGCGYGQPEIHPSGEFVVCNYTKGGLKTKAGCLVKIDLSTKNTTMIKDGYFFYPKFSADGNFLLFKRDLRQGDIDFTWIYDIYWLNLKTNEEHKIGESYDANWRN